MRSRLILSTLVLYFVFAIVACNKKTDSTSGSNANTATDAQGASAPGTPAPGAAGSGTMAPEKDTAATAMKEVKREPVVVPSGTSITVSLGSAIGSKVSQAGQTFSGSVAKEVLVGGIVGIPKGATVSGTVTDAKPLGKFAGGAELGVRLDTITLRGVDLPVQAAAKTFSAKGKGKRTAVIAGGGAALGGIIGALAGGGKGAAIGLAAGGGAGAGGAAFTGNKDIVLPAESALTFVLSQSFTVKQ
jgi:hypothetical protein